VRGAETKRVVIFQAMQIQCYQQGGCRTKVMGNFLSDVEMMLSLRGVQEPEIKIVGNCLKRKH